MTKSGKPKKRAAQTLRQQAEAAQAANANVLATLFGIDGGKHLPGWGPDDNRVAERIFCSLDVDEVSDNVVILRIFPGSFRTLRNKKVIELMLQAEQRCGKVEKDLLSLVAKLQRLGPWQGCATEQAIVQPSSEAGQPRGSSREP